MKNKKCIDCRYYVPSIMTPGTGWCHYLAQEKRENNHCGAWREMDRIISEKQFRDIVERISLHTDIEIDDMVEVQIERTKITVTRWSKDNDGEAIEDGDGAPLAIDEYFTVV